MTPVLQACTPADVPALLELWRTSRAPHAVTEDRAEDVRALVERFPGSSARDGAVPATAH